jgi:hypothetical protein
MAIASNFPSTRPSLLLDFANVGRLDPRVTFTRASSGTYYDGVTTAKAEENLFLQSQAFNETAWTKSGTTITPNDTAAPDGTTTADKAEQTTTSNPYVRQSVTVSGQYQFSVFVKYIDIQWIRFLIGSNSVWFDVQNGVVGTAESGLTGTIEPSTNGFYRLIVDATGLSGATLFYTIGADADNSTGEALGSYYLWGAQLEQRSAVTAYTATTTQPVTNYIPVLQTAAAGVARFDHNPTTGEALGLLIEEQRTNLVTYSDDFANAAWTKTNSSVTSNTIVAPDGTLTGDKLVESATTAEHNVRQDTASQSAATYTFSIYAKAAERGYLQFVGTGVLPGQRANFDLLTGVTGSVDANMTANIEPVGNGWYRCSVTAASSSTGALRAQWNIITSSTAARVQSYAGDGYSGLYLWGCDVEAGAFATSYIPTTTASVTRNADAASMTGTNFSSWYNAGEGTVYVDFALNGIASVNKAINFDNGAGFANSIDIYANSGTPRLDVYVSSSSQTNLTPSGGALSVNTFVKFDGVYKVNDFAACRNGGTVVTDTSGTIPTVSRACIGNSNLITQFLNGTIRKIAYYPIRLTNAQLQALTG